MKLNAKRTAVLTLDVQNDLVAITPGLKERKVLENIQAVVKAARKKKTPVMHVTASARSDFADIPSNSPLWISIREQKAMILGTPGAAIHNKIKPLKSELVFNKSCVDPFLTTGLGQALNNNDVDTLVLTGLWTNWVVEATARHASDMGYKVFLVEDACASNTQENHDFAVQNVLPTICYIVSTAQTLKALK